MKFAFVIADPDSRQIDAAEAALFRLGAEMPIERREVPGTSETVLACRCIAELTEIDAVIVFLPEDENQLVMAAALEGLTEVVLDWNMPIVTSLSYKKGAKMAEAAAQMVEMQIEMEDAAARNTLDTSVN
ncbi:MAG: hypothetical protein SOZ00_05180 [Tidjanibacter sp.]|nr:hypothetical protein [Tidjanibacter sp.]